MSDADQVTVVRTESLAAVIVLGDEAASALMHLLNVTVGVGTIPVNSQLYRKEDLARLEKFFRDRIAQPNINGVIPGDYEKLGRVLAADPTLPLEPQLGFDPDVY